jgi:hypothetical protein
MNESDFVIESQNETDTAQMSVDLTGWESVVFEVEDEE